VCELLGRFIVPMVKNQYIYIKGSSKSLCCPVHSSLGEERKHEDIVHQISRYILKSNQLKTDNRYHVHVLGL
jgi:hypothetical protein